MYNVVRIPVKLKAIKRHRMEFVGYRQKLAELCASYVPKDFMVLELVKHYEMVARDFLKKSSYNVLGGKGKNHKNWSIFMKFNDLCMSKGYDGKVYIEAQFHKAGKYWTNGRYPFPNMLLGDKAEQCYEMHTRIMREKYAKDVHADKKMAAKETLSFQSQILKDIAQTASNLKFYMGSVHNVSNLSFVKVSIIYSFWTSFSPYYLYSVPWFRSYINELIDSGEGHSALVEMASEFDRIDKSQQLQRIICDGVYLAEDELSIPSNISLQ